MFQSIDIDKFQRGKSQLFKMVLSDDLNIKADPVFVAIPKADKRHARHGRINRKHILRVHNWFKQKENAKRRNSLRKSAAVQVVKRTAMIKQEAKKQRKPQRLGKEQRVD